MGSTIRSIQFDLTKAILLGGLLAAIIFNASPARSQGGTSPEVLKQAEEKLPDGPGKAPFLRNCGLCHSLNTPMRARHSPEDWDDLVRHMVEIGAPLKASDIPLVADYLSKTFPGGPKPSGVEIPGSVKVTLREWEVPTHGSEPHDALYAKDGMIWYAAEFGNLIGRFDPKTEKFKEYRLKTPKSNPHGLVEDKAGHIWFTAAGGRYIGELDPKTEAVKEYPIEDPAATWPHTPLFDRHGNLIFTVLNGGMIGKIDTKTGKMKVVPLPTDDAGPYGLALDSKGLMWVTEQHIPKLAGIDTQTMKITEHTMSEPTARPRRLAIDEHDVIWFSDSERGYLDRYDPKTDEFKNWPSPSGPRSFPYGVAYTKNAVWYVEVDVKPNMLVRFDPKTEKFQTWPVAPCNRVRNTSLTPNGDIWFGCSGSDHLVFAKIEGN